MAIDDEELYLKLSLLDRTVLNVIAHDLDIKSYSKQKKDQLVKKILKERKRETILKELRNNWNEIYLKLNALNRIVLNVIAHDLKIPDYSGQKKDRLIENILKKKERETILEELKNNWNEICLKLRGLDRNSLNIVAEKLGIVGYSQQESEQLIENILKSSERKTILKAISRWGKILGFMGHIGGLASIVGLLLYFSPYDINKILISYIKGENNKPLVEKYIKYQDISGRWEYLGPMDKKGFGEIWMITQNGKKLNIEVIKKGDKGVGKYDYETGDFEYTLSMPMLSNKTLTLSGQGRIDDNTGKIIGKGGSQIYSEAFVLERIEK